MIPEWLDAESLRWAIVGAIAVLVVVAAMVLRLVRKFFMRLVVVAAFGALSLGLWQQRADLQDCVETCSCRLFGQEVQIPADKNPGCE